MFVLLTLLAAGRGRRLDSPLGGVIFLGVLLFDMLVLSPVCHIHYFCLLLPLVLGLLAGAVRWIEYVLDPWVAAVYPIPKSALFPIFLLWFGLGDASKVATIAIGVLFLVLVNTITGVKSINPVLLKAARDLGATQRQVFTKVILPGALPNIFTGLRLGAGMALILVFITEIEATKAGLGFLLWEAFQLLDTRKVFAGVVTFGILGVATTWLLQWIERRACPWARR